MFIKEFTYKSVEDIKSVYRILVKNMQKYEFEYSILKESDSELVFKCSRLPCYKKLLFHYECFITINKTDDLYHIILKPNYMGFEIFYMLITIVELVNIIIMIYICIMNGWNEYFHNIDSGFWHVIFLHFTYHNTYRSLDKKHILKEITNSILNS